MDETERALWLAQRAGKLTASRMGVAMDFLKTGAPSKARSDYMRDLLAERITGYSVRHFVNPAMERGLAYEDEAKEAYEAHTGTLITDCRTLADHGIFHHPRIDNFCSSPDGLIGRDGLIETKCPTTGTFITWTLLDGVPTEHRPQMIAQIVTTGRAWCDFVAYDPRIREPERRLIVRRFVPTPEEVREVEAAAERFLSDLDNLFDAFVSAKAA